MTSTLLAASLAAIATTTLSAKSRRLHAKEKAVTPAPIKCRDGTTVIPYLAPPRTEQLRRLREEEFDLLVIGGGCVGSGVALDAARRGLKTALIEADDFGAGTSGRSTKLIHGGIRYLETAFKKLDIESYNLVVEALEERAYMLRAAPYMNQPLPIMIPLYAWWEVPYMWVGAKVYDLLAGSRRVVPPSHFMSRDEALFNFPMLRSAGLKGAIVYYDGQMNDTRLSLVIALTSAQEGAACANRVRCLSLLKDADTGRVNGASVEDTLTGEKWNVRAAAVVNATGCFADAIRRMDEPECQDLITPAAGVHVVLPDHFSPSRMGLIVPKTSDGRVLFFLPWEGATVVGTTDSESGLTMLPRPTAEEVGFIVQECNRYLEAGIHHADLTAAWSGIRPLVKDPAHLAEGGTKALSRSHVVLTSSPGSLVTITGGKWTTFRRMAQDAVDAALRATPGIDVDGASVSASTTAEAGLVGADRAGVVCAQKFDRIGVALREEFELPRDVAGHLVRNYGTRALQIAEIARRRPEFAQRGTGEARRLSRKYPFLEAEVAFAVEQEYALTAVDVLARRTRLAFIDAASAKAAAPRVIEIMAGLLGWSGRRRREELASVERYLLTMAPVTPGRLRKHETVRSVAAPQAPTAAAPAPAQ